MRRFIEKYTCEGNAAYAFEYNGGFCVVTRGWIDIITDKDNRLYELSRRSYEVNENIFHPDGTLEAKYIASSHIMYLLEIIDNTQIDQIWLINQCQHIKEGLKYHPPQRPWL